MRYQPFGAIASQSMGNGLISGASYDTDGRLTGLSAFSGGGGLVQSLTFAYNANNRLTGITNGRPSGQSQAFTYDELDRLLSSSSPGGGAESFTYDANGNRASHLKSGITTAFTYDTLGNRLLSASKPGLTRVWTHNSAGDSTGFTGADGAAVGFDYDAWGRIVSSARQSVTTAYLVNALGQRVSKVGPSSTSRFIYAPDGYLLAEYSTTGGWTNYVRGNGALQGFVRGGQPYFVHNDQLGRPEIVTNLNQSVVWAATNFAFDRVVTTDTIGGLNLGLPGQYFDDETKLWHNYFRDYDASTGRYVQMDPVGLTPSTNPYAYASGNPVQRTDPRGLDDWTLIHQHAGLGQQPTRTGSDFYHLNVNYYVGTFSVTVTRSGTVYLGGGVSKGNPAQKKVGWSVTAGEVKPKDGCPPDNADIDGYVNGGSTGVSGFFLVGGGKSWNANGTANEAGFGLGGGFTPVSVNTPVAQFDFLAH